eukprot:SAG31_NODE_1742_length_7385_cov_40.678836_9_plen_115_part_00
MEKGSGRRGAAGSLLGLVGVGVAGVAGARSEVGSRAVGYVTSPRHQPRHQKSKFVSRAGQVCHRSGFIDGFQLRNTGVIQLSIVWRGEKMRCEWSEMGTNGSSDECHTLWSLSC